MTKTLKRLSLLALLVLVCAVLIACNPDQGRTSGELAPDDPLRATLTVLEATATHLQQGAAPAGVMSETDQTVPQTGGGQPQETAAPLPVMNPQNTPTLACPAHDAKMSISASQPVMKVGETLTVQIKLVNTGCVALGLPQYQLAILNGDGKAIFSPDKPAPIVHSLAVVPGKTDEVSYTLMAVSPGKATLSVFSSFEVHLGYPGPAYWGASSSDSLVIQVEP